MPFILPVAGVAAAAVSTAAIVSTVALVGATIGISVLTSKGGPPSKQLKAQEGRLSASIDPGTARKMVFGRTAMATDVRYQAFTGTGQEYYHQIVCCASHRVESIEELWLDQELAWSSTSGVAAKFSGYLTVTPILEGSAANAIDIDGNWNAANGCRLTGCAYLHIRYKRTGANKDNESPFSASITTRMTIVGKGCPVYDVRYDSTRGGSGPMRADDQSTWAFTISGNDVGNNPAAQIATFKLGWRINGKLATGCGMPANRISWARSITSANACDETVTLAAGGSEPRYRTACVIGESDERGAAFDLWKQSCNALLRDAGGLLAFDVMLNDIATPIVTFTEDDVLSAGTYKQAESLPDYRNIVRGKFTDARSQSLYQLVDWPESGVSAPDGIDRILTINYPGVQSVSQAQRLAKGQLQRRQFGGQLQIEVGQRGWIAQVGDPVRLTFWPLEFTNKAFRVAETKPSIDGRVQMLLTEESTTFYAWLNEDAPAVTLPTPTTYDYLNNPLVVGSLDDVNAAEAAKLAGIESYATSADNMIVNASLAVDTTGWVLSGGVLRQTGSAGEPSPGHFMFPASTPNNVAIANDNVKRPLNGAATLFLSGYSNKGTGTVGAFDAVVDWYNAAGTYISSSVGSIMPGGFNSWLPFSTTASAPAGAALFIASLQRQNSSGTVYAGALRVAKTEPEATRNNYYVQSSAPSSPADGSLWKDTSLNPPKFKLRTGGAWVDVSNLVTDTNQIGDGAGLGLTALWSNVAGTTNAPESLATRNNYYVGASDPGGTNGALWKDTSTTPARFRLKVAGSWVDVSSLVTDTAQITDGANLGLTAVWSGVTGSGKPEDSADVTMLVTGPTAANFAYTYVGVAKTGEFARDLNFRLVRGANSDITTSAAWSATLKTGTASFTIGAATGILNVTALSSDAIVEVSAVYNSLTRKASVALLMAIDPPPTAGGGGSGSGGTSSTSTIAQTSSTTYGAANTAVLSCAAGSGGQVACTFPATFKRTVNGYNGAYGKWQWRVVGGSFADITSEIASTVNAVKDNTVPEPYNDPGSISVAMTKTGLTAGVTYEFQLLLRNDDAITVNWFGTAATVGS